MLIKLNLDEKTNKQLLQEMNEYGDNEKFIEKLYEFKTKLLGKYSKTVGSLANELLDFGKIRTRREYVFKLHDFCMDAYEVMKNTFNEAFRESLFPVDEYPADDILFRILKLSSYLYEYELLEDEIHAKK